MYKVVSLKEVVSFVLIQWRGHVVNKTALSMGPRIYRLVIFLVQIRAPIEMANYVKTSTHI